nr:unnamed protein product [Callosobruchus analis]
MFTIHTYVNNMYIPLVYCLLKDKRKQSYNEVMSIIKNKCLELGLLFRPGKDVSDFEKAIHSGILQCFPTTEIIGCRFHLSQAWWRKIQTLGLTVEYKDTSSIVGRYLHYFFGLTFLDPHEVGDAFVELMEELPQDRRISEFCDYLVVVSKKMLSFHRRSGHRHHQTSGELQTVVKPFIQDLMQGVRILILTFMFLLNAYKTVRLTLI